MKNIKQYGLYTKKYKAQSDLLIKKLGYLPLFYQGNMTKFTEYLNELIITFPLYSNFLNNYFISYYKEYFISGDYNYNNIPLDCRSNSFLENYNRYLKEKLDKKRIITIFII